MTTARKTRRPAAKAAPAPILLRVPDDMMGRMETALRARPVRIPRHTWILEAIHEKLGRELPKR